MQGNESRLLAQYHVARALAEAETLREAAPVILRSICEPLDWDVGGLWLVDGATGALRFAEIWCSSMVQAGAFVAASREQVFPRGVGLPGRVLASGKPAWISDVLTEPDFRRTQVAAAAGLHAAFAFPIRLGEKILGVFDFFSTKALAPDELLLKVMDGIGSQIGQFDERRRAEQAVSDGLREMGRLHERIAVQHEDLSDAHAALEVAYGRLARLANTSEFTGIANLEALRDRMADLVAEGRTTSLVLLDLDQFGDLNRALGRRAGDQFLQEVAKTVGARVRAFDLVARYGGDELAVLLPDADAAVAVGLAEELRQQVRALPCPLRPISASLGVSTRKLPEAPTEDLIAAAERALADARKAGGDRVVHHAHLLTVSA